MHERRRFLQAFTVLVAAPAALADVHAGLDIRTVDFTAGLSQAKFEALLGETFYVHTTDQGSPIVRLARVAGRVGPARPEQFSLFFQADRLPRLSAGSYDVEHYLAGRIMLYLEPSAGAVYRADFSLL